MPAAGEDARAGLSCAAVEVGELRSAVWPE